MTTFTGLPMISIPSWLLHFIVSLSIYISFQPAKTTVCENRIAGLRAIAIELLAPGPGQISTAPRFDEVLELPHLEKGQVETTPTVANFPLIHAAYSFLRVLCSRKKASSAFMTRKGSSSRTEELESSNRTFTFDDVEAPPFNLLTHWFYSERVPASIEELMHVTSSPRYKIELVELKALALAERFDVPALHCALSDSLANKRIQYPPYYELVIYAFETVIPGHPFLELLIDAHCAHWRPAIDYADPEEEDLKADLPIDFLLGTMEWYRNMRNGTDIRSEKYQCYYHLHDSGFEEFECDVGTCQETIYPSYASEGGKGKMQRRWKGGLKNTKSSKMRWVVSGSKYLYALWWLANN
ncbi:hypothetical protein P154DRAFT_622398 [Amniculicola lignicola CBS 123094]|uniref:BTB domain-containing protein n=1 Tax=Amniculicola lignicola CBS 123094 TaxID=1392246 RepID=A0A6A5WIN9_9PLEO|nr:hypothetical protein P154DRAFT_622398 [Amniculicola lignicola CBS 123094]